VRIPVWICLFLSLWLNGCAHETLVEVPVPVEVVRVERIPVPADLLVTEAPAEIPEGLTYGQAIHLWSIDRAKLETVNGRIDAVRALE
jgi:hypothetical protein